MMAISRVGFQEILKLIGMCISKSMFNKGLGHYQMSDQDYWAESVSKAILIDTPHTGQGIVVCRNFPPAAGRTDPQLFGHSERVVLADLEAVPVFIDLRDAGVAERTLTTFRIEQAGIGTRRWDRAAADRRGPYLDVT